MRLAVFFLSAVLALPAAAQSLSPTAGSPGPAAAAPGAPPTMAPAESTPGPAIKTPTKRTRRSAQQRFTEANTSHDGKLTLEQAQTAKMRRVVDNFDAIDTKKHGYVTMAEIKAFNHQQRMARKNKH